MQFGRLQYSYSCIKDNVKNEEQTDLLKNVPIMSVNSVNPLHTETALT